MIEGQATAIDGDTLTIEGLDKKLRLHGVDAPETGDPYAEEATILLQAMLGNETVRCEWTEAGVWGRPIATCYAQTKAGNWSSLSVNARLVRVGGAMAYSRYSRDYVDEQTAAARDCLLIWEEFAPWCMRRKAK